VQLSKRQIAAVMGGASSRGGVGVFSNMNEEQPLTPTPPRHEIAAPRHFTISPPWTPHNGSDPLHDDNSPSDEAVESSDVLERKLHDYSVSAASILKVSACMTDVDFTTKARWLAFVASLKLMLQLNILTNLMTLKASFKDNQSCHILYVVSSYFSYNAKHIIAQKFGYGVHGATRAFEISWSE